MAELNPLQTFGLRRRKWVASTARTLAAVAFNYHRIVVEGAENIPQEGTALLLPKHRAYRDILLEGVVIYRTTRRYATYIMKAGLYGILELAGGVKIVRPKDIRRVKDREARRARIQWARDKNRQTVNYLAWLYGQGEVVVSHPEGMRYQDIMGPMQREIIDHLLGVEEQFGLKIPIIPIGLEYESYSRPRSRVYFRIDEPLYATHFSGPNELLGAVEERILTLSGLSRDAGSAKHPV